ncbi:MAG: DUF192 domain-containing protein [Thermoleophilaceae bacterium]|nr:DUF192 domain-containing protein [Thermoleophilaceae bacterium]
MDGGFATRVGRIKRIPARVQMLQTSLHVNRHCEVRRRRGWIGDLQNIVKYMEGVLQPEKSIALAVVAAKRLKRLRGLIGRPPPAPGSALLIPHCSAVHGFFMRYSIDLVFVDANLRVMAVTELRPWRMASCRGALHVFELRQGEARRLKITPSCVIQKTFA